jgi:hypothetical protein
MSSEHTITWFGPVPAAPAYIRRIAWTSLWLGAIAAILLWAATGGRWALGFAAGAALGVANFLLLAAVMREIVTLETRSHRRIAMLVAIKVVFVYGGLVLLLASKWVPILSAVIGFSLILGVIVLKAVGRALIGTPATRRGAN